jgi:hypothetical protein
MQIDEEKIKKDALIQELMAQRDKALLECLNKAMDLKILSHRYTELEQKAVGANGAEKKESGQKK